MIPQKKVLVTAYAVNPYKGSEDGTGWNISFELAKTHKVAVITRKNNRPEIERYLAEVNDPAHENMEFYYYDLTNWLMRLKHKLGERGYVLYYYLWQLFLPFFIKRNKIEFDLSHALNFHSDSHPQFLWTLGKPVFWGPIGHHPSVPTAYVKKVYGNKNWIKDRIYNGVKFMMRNFDPFFYLSKWTAKRIFVINSGVNSAVKANPEKVIILPAVANNTSPKLNATSKNDTFTILSVGRFVYMKGFDVVIRAFGHFYHGLSQSEQKNVKLQLVGKGEELEKMKTLIRDNDIQNAVEIIAWVPKSEMTAIYENASVFCFGSHEGAGMVIPEALSYRLPVICFNNYGPGELCNDECAIRIPYGKYEESILEFSAAIHQLYLHPKEYQSYADNAFEFAKEKFNWSTKANVINSAYNLI